MTRIFEVKGFFAATQLRHELEFDGYVPLQFRRYETHHGCGYLELGNGTTTLLDIAVDAGTQMVRALNITSPPPLADWPRKFDISSRISGLPFISTSFESYSVVEVKRDFEVAVNQRSLIVYWARPGDCEAVIFHETDFLIQEGEWIGTQFRDLTKEQMDAFLGHFEQK